MMMEDKGDMALPCGTGPSQAEPVVSALRASVPSAWLEPEAFKPNRFDGKPRQLPADLKAELQELVDKIMAHVEWLPEQRKATLLEACMSVSPVNCSWQQHSIAEIAVWKVQHLLAQAIEAAAADETGTGSAEGESAVADGHAPLPNQDTPHE